MSEDFSEDKWNEIAERVELWTDQFVQSHRFEDLGESDQDEARAVIDFFARYSYEYLDAAPEDWNSRGVRECCVAILPRKITAELVFFEALVPVLSEFFIFLEESGFLSHTRELAAKVTGLEEEIIAAASDPSLWGPAKRFMMQAMAAGVDLGDQAALDRFMLAYNRQFTQNFAQAKPMPAPPPRASLPPAPVPFRRTQPKLSRNDPCPCGSGKKLKRCCGS